MRIPSSIVVISGLLLYSLTSAPKAFAQPDLVWAYSMGSNSQEYGNVTTVDALGNIYTSGTFWGTVDFDPGPGVTNLVAAGLSWPDMFITKHNPDGSLAWAKKIGANFYETVRAITTDLSGNVLLTGHFGGATVDFDPGPGTALLTNLGYEDTFILKLNSSGIFQWAKRIGGAGYEIGESIDTDASDNVIVTGYFGQYQGFGGTADFDPGTGSFPMTATGTSYDVFVTKLDASGNFSWAFQLGGTGQDYGRGVSIDASNRVLVTGSFVGTVDFQPNIEAIEMTAYGGADVFVGKYDPTGGYMWAKQMGGVNDDNPTAIATDASSNIYTTGNFHFGAGEPADFDPDEFAQFPLTPFAGGTGNDIFVSKIDQAGDFVWAKQLGGTEDDQSYSLALDASSNVYTIGSFTGTADFDPNPAAVGTFNLNSTDGGYFISKLDNAGDFTMAMQEWSLIYGIAVDASSNIITTGGFGATVDFAPGACLFNLTSNGGNDIYIRKISQTTIPAPTITLVNPLTGPAGTPFTINGTNFSTNPINNIVRFNELAAPVSPPSTTILINTAVPTGALDAQISVTVGCHTAVSSAVFDVTGTCNIPVHERTALESIYNNTDGANWPNNLNWLTPDESTWEGVTVTGCRVTELDLSNNQLDGNIYYTSISNLTFLEILRLNDNSTLTGFLPANIGNLISLRELHGQHCDFTGSLPSSLENCTSLEVIDLEDNGLDGGVPTFLGSMTNLRSINLGYNNLGGDIPLELGDLTNLVFLSLAGNGFTGSIPVELENLNSLELLDLSNNQLDGSIPVELGNLGVLKSLQLWSNSLTGSIPVEIGNLSNLENLDLSQNLLAGPLLLDFSGLTNLHNLALQYNQFAGDFPASISSLTSLNSVNISNNQFTSIPTISTYDLFVENNFLDFGDLEPNDLSSVNFSYDPQGKLPPGGTISFTVGGTLTIPFIATGSDNSYQWYKGAVPVAGATSLTLIKPGMTVADVGNYYLEITNSFFPGFSLQSEPYIVTTDPCVATTPVTGDLDLTFDPDPTYPASAVALQSTGKIIVSRYTGGGGSYEYFEVVRLNTDGSLDDTFTPLTHDWGGYYSGLIVQPNDYILNYYPYVFSEGEQFFQMAPDGGDDIFDLYPDLYYNYIYYVGAAALQTDGKIIVSGNWSDDPRTLTRFEEYDDGAGFIGYRADDSFVAPAELAPDVSMSPDLIRVIKVQPDQHILLGGSFPGGIVRLDPTGAIDPTFTAYIDDEVYDIALQADGKIIIVGEFRNVNDFPYNGVARLNPDGSIDPAFNIIGITDLPAAESHFTKVTIMSDGKIVVAGQFNSINGIARKNLARLNADGTVDCLFDPGTSTDALIIDMILQPDNKILIAGDFTEYDGVARNGFARVNNGVSSTTCVPPAERAALVALYNSTNGAAWNNNSGWLSADESNWYGVTLNGCDVYEIKLDNNNLSGTLPAEIGDLPGLVHLILNDNNLTSTLPVELGNLSNMDFLILSNNNLSGPIPQELGALSNLFNLDISSNQLTGSIPIELGNLSSLGYLGLSFNQLTGTIPSQLGNIPTLLSIDLAHNSLTGSIPTSLGNLMNLAFIDFNTNQLTGTIPAELGNTSLGFLRLSNNQLTGAIPSSLGNLTDLYLLDLAQNLLTGSIPKELGSLSFMKYLVLNQNKLSGNIPVELGNLTLLEDLIFYDNQLTGSLPVELGQCINLKRFGAGDNQLSGTLPKEYGSWINLTDFGINNNTFTGAVPVEYLAWTQPVLLYFSGNRLDAIPTFTASTITELNVFDNLFEFGDLEPVIGVTGINYSPQAKLPPGGTLSVNENSPINIPFSTSGSANSYQWFKDGSPITGATLATFTKANSTLADAGTYHVVVTSSIVTGLTLQSEDYIVSINPVTPPTILATLITLPIQGGTTIDLIPLITTTNSLLDINSLQIIVAPSSGALANIDANGILTLDYSGINFSGTETFSIRACDMAGNCTIGQFEVEVIGDIVVYNALSPNGDNVNEKFIIQFVEIIPDAQNNHVTIYNRWGDVVWEGTNYNNSTVVFDGTNKNGKELPAGTYFYKIDFGSSRKTINGYLSLKR